MKPTSPINKITFFHVIVTAFVVLTTFVADTTHASPITQNNVFHYLNQERINRGLKPFTIDSDLTSAAYRKSKDMLNRNYFEHFAYGLTPWDFIRNTNYDYMFAGENLAMNFATSEGMVRAWMNSPAHRDNILNPNYEDIGIGIVKGSYTEIGKTTHETTMVTTMFGKKKSFIYRAIDRLKKTFPIYSLFE